MESMAELQQQQQQAQAAAVASMSGREASMQQFQMQHQQLQQQQIQLQLFWQKQQKNIEAIDSEREEFKRHSLPLARIKKIMKLDEEVQMISAEAPVLFAKACEMFIMELTMRSWIHTEENKRRTLQRNDIATAITKTDVFDCLIDIVPRDDVKPSKKDEMPQASVMPAEHMQYYLMQQQAAAQQQYAAAQAAAAAAGVGGADASAQGMGQHVQGAAGREFDAMAYVQQMQAQSQQQAAMMQQMGFGQQATMAQQMQWQQQAQQQWHQQMDSMQQGAAAAGGVQSWQQMQQHMQQRGHEMGVGAPVRSSVIDM